MPAADVDAFIGDFGCDDRDEFAFVGDIQDVKAECVGGRLNGRIDWNISIY